MKRLQLISAAVVIAVVAGYGQNVPTHPDGVFVDTSGVMRWKDTKDEVRLFGVNYTTPFAYSYRAHSKLGIPLKGAIDLDVAQMARLGFDGYRVHVWDREISTEKGDLIENEHLDLFDYLLAQLARHGIKSIVTPIAWWGNGWPEPDEPAPGFSEKFGKGELITNSAAREAQRNYLRQFIEHTNPYSGVSYKDDPSIIALEIINEPRHPESAEATRDYVNEMVHVLRATGYAKPMFYNISENWSPAQARAVGTSLVDGVSFQWYPTGLVHRKMLKGNYLANVSGYPVPSEGVEGYDRKAKMVYEFDAADVGGSYMYPAMIRSFCEAGMQFAAMFSYDPVQIAWSNTEYPTHYLNLLYTPSKAISAMIAGKALHVLPRQKSFGSFPQNNRFDDFLVSHERDLSELNAVTDFMYSGTTAALPTNVTALQHVAGCGNSVVVRYDGNGAYFLDKLEPGIWRLEVYPDVLWLRDPFGVTSMSRQVARLFWRQRAIKINLPDVGKEYSLGFLSGPSEGAKPVADSTHVVAPGVYLVWAGGADDDRVRQHLKTRASFLEGLYTPHATPPGIYVVNRSARCAVAASGPAFKFQIAADRSVSSPRLFVRRLGWRGWSESPLKESGGFDFVPADSSRSLGRGIVEYCVTVESGDTTFTFPGGVPGSPGAWDFEAGSLWQMRIVAPGEPFALLDIRRDREDLVFPQWTREMRYTVEYGNGAQGEEVSLDVTGTFSGENPPSFGIQLNVSEFSQAIGDQMHSYRKIRVKARSPQGGGNALTVALVMNDGSSFSGEIRLTSRWTECELPLSAMKVSKSLMLPNSYPVFLPRVRGGTREAAPRKPDLRSLEAVQIVVDPRRQGRNRKEMSFRCEVVSVTLLE